MQLSLLTIFQVLTFSFEAGIDHLNDYASGTKFLSKHFQRIVILVLKVCFVLIFNFAKNDGTNEFLLAFCVSYLHIKDL